MRVTVRIAGLAAGATLVLWCATIATRSFTPQAGAGLPRLSGGAGLQLLLGLAALIGAGLVVAAAFALSRPAFRSGQPLWLVPWLLGWAGLAASVASRAADLFLAPVNMMSGAGPGVTSAAAPAWQTWFWVVAAVCAGLAAGLLVRSALASRTAARLTHPAA